MPKGVYDRSKVKKTEKTATTVPIKVEVKADPLNLQVTVDPASLEKATAIIQERCRELASYFEIPGDQVNPFEALFLIADLLKEIRNDTEQMKTYLKMIAMNTDPARR